MNREFGILLCTAALGAGLVSVGTAAPARQTEYGRLPLAFEPNRGQAAAGIDYLAHGAGYSISLLRGGILLNVRSASGRNERKVAVSFAGGRPTSNPTAIEE